MKKQMKRLLALVMAVFMLLPAASLFATAATTANLPIVYVVGKYVHIYTKEATKEDARYQLYPLKKPVGDVIKDNMDGLVAAYSASESTENWKIFADKIYDVLYPSYEPLMMDGNGNPRGGTHVIPVAEPKKKTSGFTLDDYNFTYDSRLDPYTNADLLNTYINKVLTATGKSQVNLIGRCLGTTVMATYLTKYGASKVRTSIFYASAFNGVYMMDGFFSADIDISYQMLQYYLTYGKSDEGGDFESVHKIADVFKQMGLLSAGVNKVNQVIEKMAPYLFPKLILLIFGTWPGHWAMISSGAYEKAKAVTLQDTNKYAGLIKKIDKYQTKVMAKFPETLEKLRKEGMRIAIVCKYNSPLIPLSPDSDMQADGTVELKTMSLGATAADMGKTLSSAYIRVLRNGNNTDYLSPDLVVDAHTCKYPNYTWFVKNCPHADYPPEIDQMFIEIFNASKQYSITTNTKFPQFMNYNAETKKISPITGPDSGADMSSGVSSAFFSRIVEWIRNFMQRILGLFINL